MTIRSLLRHGLFVAGTIAIARRHRCACRGPGAARLQPARQGEIRPRASRTPISSRIRRRRPSTPVDKLPVDKIKLPAGFKAEVWSSGHPGARTMVHGRRRARSSWARGSIGRVYAITDKDGKREAKVLLQGLTQPNGLAVQGRRALRVRDQQGVPLRQHREQARQSGRAGVELTDKFNLPRKVHHNWKYVAFGPDGKLYVQVGANCNICELNPGIHGQIRRYNADGTGMEIVARGVRNTVGFDWHPVTKELWFTDNGRDWAGDAGPEDELNRVAKGQEGAILRLPLLPRQRHSRSGHQEAESLRRRGHAGRADRPAFGRPRHQVLHRQHVPEELPERRLHRAARLLEPEQKFGYDVVVARTTRRQGQDRAVPDRPARREEERVPRPADLSCCRCRTARCWCPTSRTARSIASPTQAKSASR